jgi:hypothetical protein
MPSTLAFSVRYSSLEPHPHLKGRMILNRFTMNILISKMGLAMGESEMTPTHQKEKPYSILVFGLQKSVMV